MRKGARLLLPAVALLVAGCGVSPHLTTASSSATPSPKTALSSQPASIPEATSGAGRITTLNSLSFRLQVFQSFAHDLFKYSVDAGDADIVNGLVWSWGHLDADSMAYDNAGDPRYIYGLVAYPDDSLGEYVKHVALTEPDNTEISETIHQNGPDRLIHGVTVVSDQIGPNDVMTWHVQYIDGWWFLTGLSGPMGTYGNMQQTVAAPVTTAPPSICTNIASQTIPCTGSPPVAGSHPFDYGAACVSITPSQLR